MQVEVSQTQPGVAGIILTGGQSRRMGRAKALLPVPGRDGLTFVEYLASLLSEMCREMLLVARDERSCQKHLLLLEKHQPLRLIYDCVPDQGPLMGLWSGLQASSFSHALVLAVDLPLVEPALLAWLCAFPLTDEILMPRVQGIPQVLLARYPRSVLPALEVCLQGGRRDPRALLDLVPVRFLEEETLRAVDPDLRSFLNVNTPADLQEARAIAKPPVIGLHQDRSEECT
jgi:molybdenum cofactor guanylyltransferase